MNKGMVDLMKEIVGLLRVMPDIAEKRRVVFPSCFWETRD